jgi:hypothetical protein
MLERPGKVPGKGSIARQADPHLPVPPLQAKMALSRAKMTPLQAK